MHVSMTLSAFTYQASSTLLSALRVRALSEHAQCIIFIDRNGPILRTGHLHQCSVRAIRLRIPRDDQPLAQALACVLFSEQDARNALLRRSLSSAVSACSHQTATSAHLDVRAGALCVQAGNRQLIEHAIALLQAAALEAAHRVSADTAATTRAHATLSKHLDSCIMALPLNNRAAIGQQLAASAKSLKVRDQRALSTLCDAECAQPCGNGHATMSHACSSEHAESAERAVSTLDTRASHRTSIGDLLHRRSATVLQQYFVHNRSLLRTGCRRIVCEVIASSRVERVEGAAGHVSGKCLLSSAHVTASTCCTRQQLSASEVRRCTAHPRTASMDSWLQ